ncbi:MAG TPA: response regulator transcription factor [Acidobacteria bacterium]|nr:response regulator transcription factor [Acidobacteriota bacterium]
MSRVFVVDDEPDVVELLQTVLEIEGYEVETATDGRAALARLLADPPDLLILDLMMPDLDGMELLKLLRLDPAAAGVPVLILSARTGQHDQIATLQLGANAYICKPFSTKELVVQVRQLLGGASGGDADE